ncbi:hypothetical protein JCM15519_05290 [Fundidesulfovibrio butyratiphilus]
MTALNVRWTSTLEVGEPDIDEQHQMLFQMILDLEEKIEGKQFEQGALDALQGMRIYAATHFAHEEELMALGKFSDLPRHKSMHAEFIGEIDQLEKDARQSGEWASLDVFAYLVAWLSEHILQEDTDFFRRS